MYFENKLEIITIDIEKVTSLHMFDSCKGSCHIFFLLTLASSRARCYIYSLMDVKNLSATGLSSWLEEKGVQDSYCEVFESISLKSILTTLSYVHCHRYHLPLK